MPKFRCEHCRQKIAAPDTHIGKRVRCPRCKEIVRVPEATEIAPAVVAEQAVATPAPLPPPAVVPPAAREPIYVPPQAVAPPADLMQNTGSASDTVVTSRAEEDFSSLFAGAPAAQAPVADEPSPFSQNPISQEPAESSPFEEPPAPEPQPEAIAPESAPQLPPPVEKVAEFVVTPAEVIEARPRKRKAPVDSAAEVQDLLDKFEPPAQPPPPERPVQPVREFRAGAPGVVRGFGMASVLAGVGAIGLSVLPAFSRFAVPTGAAGVVLALLGLVIAAGKRSRGIGMPVGGAVLSAGGIAGALLMAWGILPGFRKAPLPRAGQTPVVLIRSTTQPADQPTPPDGYIPATSPIVVNGAEIRIASAILLRPAVYTGSYSSLHTLDERRLQITLEFKAVGPDSVIYQPWRRTETGDEAKLTDPAGNILPIDLSASRPDVPAMLPVGALMGPTLFSPRDRPTTDVLLFNPPATPEGNLKLDLPGANIGAPNTTLHILIPKAMVQVQAS